MSNLMKLFGTLMAVLGLVLGVIVLAKPGLLEARGIQLDTAAILLVGGIVSLGLGGVIDTLRSQRGRAVADIVPAAKAEAPLEALDVAKAGLVRKPAEAAAVTTAAVAAAATTVAEVAAKPAADAKKADPVQETISALEQAKADVIKSMGGMDAIGAAPAPAAATPAAEEAAEPAEESEDDLYVVEEKVIRGRPARILSDDTVEAETDEGWMRFENLEHLNEYLDSIEEEAT